MAGGAGGPAVVPAVAPPVPRETTELAIGNSRKRVEYFVSDNYSFILQLIVYHITYRKNKVYQKIHWILTKTKAYDIQNK